MTLLKELFQISSSKSFLSEEATKADASDMQDFANENSMELIGAFIVTDPEQMVYFNKATEDQFAAVKAKPAAWSCFYVEGNEYLSAWVPKKLVKKAPKNLVDMFDGNASSHGFGGHYDPEDHRDMHKEMVAAIGQLGGKVSAAKLRQYEEALHVIKLADGSALVITSRND